MSTRLASNVRNAVWLAALIIASFATKPALAQLVREDGSSMPSLLYDWQFAADKSLAAQINQGIVFTLDEHGGLGRYMLPGSAYRFCLKGGGGYYKSINVETLNGRVISRLLDPSGCIQAKVPKGIFSISLGHRAWPGPPPGVTAVVRASGLVSAPSPVPPVPLVDSQGSPLGGYWAIQDLNLNARGTFGNRLLSTTPNSESKILVDPSPAFDALSLFQLPPFSGEYVPALPLNSTNRWSVFFNLPYVVDVCGTWCGNAYGPPPPYQINDAGNYEFSFKMNPPLTISLYADTSQNPIPLSVTLGGIPADTFQVLFRFFPDGTVIGNPNPGEVAIYQTCDYQPGKAAVFIPLEGAGVVSGPYDLAALSSSFTTLNGTGKAVRIGKGSSIYWGPNSSSIQGAVVSNTSCLSQSPTGPLFVEPVSNTVVVAHDLLNKSCVDCSFGGQTLNLTAGSAASDFSGWNFSGADFSNSTVSNMNLNGANLSGVKFIGATLTDVDLSGAQVSSNGLDFTGATLTRVIFNGVDISNFNFSNGTLSSIDLSQSSLPGGHLTLTGATLNQVNLSGLNPSAFAAAGAKLCGASLTGSPNNLLDLTSGNFANVQVTLSSSCAANLSYTQLAAIVPPGSQWTGLNLTGTVITGLQGGQVLSTQANPLNLSGVNITGMWLQGVVLDYATGLSQRDLTGVHFSNSSLRFVNLSGSKMYGAKLGNANLEGANMSLVALTRSPDQTLSAADLGGAFLRNVNLSQSQLSGASFTDASFYSQTAVGTGLCTVNSNGFTTTCATAAGSTMDATVFNNAYLFGVDFTNTTAQGVNFSNAFLTGANFSGATLTAGSAGTDTGFLGAFLQGTNMAGLTLKNDISLQDAFVDFTPGGNVLTLILNNHTGFAGYWNTPGDPVCAQMTYNSPTTVPTTNNLITCPDANQYTSGCGNASVDGSNHHWKSGSNITTQASYANNATYTNAPVSGNPICTADLKWVPINLDAPAPGPGTPKPRPKRHGKPGDSRDPHHPGNDLDPRSP